MEDYVSSTICCVPGSVSTKLGHRKTVTFHPIVVIILVPHVKEYHDARLASHLWWRQRDLDKNRRKYCNPPLRNTSDCSNELLSVQISSWTNGVACNVNVLYDYFRKLQFQNGDIYSKMPGTSYNVLFHLASCQGLNIESDEIILFFIQKFRAMKQ